jgi:anti-sigma factor RsiW
MNCTQAREALPGLLYGDLPPDETTAVQGHLADCSVCRTEYTALQRLRKALDTAPPVPAVQVDLPRLYQQAGQFQERRLRRWRRAALAAFAAAAVVLLLFGLSLELRVQGHQLVVRWGSPPPEGVTPTPAPQPVRQDVAQVPPSVVLVSEEELRLMKDLIHALAADVKSRDRQQQEALTRLQLRLEALQTLSNRRWADTERTHTVFYTALFGPREKGARP